jgi:hypothetical protein
MRLGGALQKMWEERLQAHPFHALVELTDTGLMFGASTMLATMRSDESGAPVLDIAQDRARILSLLAVAYGRTVSGNVLKHIEGASNEWARGDKALANIRLAYAKLPRLERRENAYPLFLAAAFLKSGFSPRILMKQAGLDPTALDFDRVFNPAERRVLVGHGRESGQWTSDSDVHLVAEDEKDSYEERRRLGQTSPKENVEHGRAPFELPTPLLEEGLPSKSVLIGEHFRPASNQFNTDLPGGLDEAAALFKQLAEDQTIQTEVTSAGTTRYFAPDGTQLRINADGAIRLERPIDIDGKVREVIHFSEKAW